MVLSGEKKLFLTENDFKQFFKLKEKEKSAKQKCNKSKKDSLKKGHLKIKLARRNQTASEKMKNNMNPPINPNQNL